MNIHNGASQSSGVANHNCKFPAHTTAETKRASYRRGATTTSPISNATCEKRTVAIKTARATTHAATRMRRCIVRDSWSGSEKTGTIPGMRGVPMNRVSRNRPENA